MKIVLRKKRYEKDKKSGELYVHLPTLDNEDIDSIIEAANEVMKIYENIQNLDRNGDKSTILKYAGSKGFDNILKLSSTAKEKSKSSDPEERDIYYSTLDKITYILDTILLAIDENIIKNEGKDSYYKNMKLWEEYLGTSLFEKAKKIWI